MTTKTKKLIWTLIMLISATFAALCIAFYLYRTTAAAQPEEPIPTEPPAPTVSVEDCTLMESFEGLVTPSIEEAYNAALAVKKVYWIEDDAEIAPKPNESCYGQTDDPASLQWLLDAAAEVLDGQETVFSTDLEFCPHSVATYYLDESIFVITWQQVCDDFIYTFSEVKISHPSQFRRYLAGNEYDSDYSHPVSRMGTMTNAVMAAGADFYRGRNHGIIVYEGEVKRTKYAELVDTCFIDDKGDLILVPAGEILTMEDAQKFVDENNIDFSLAFGPILVENGVRCEPDMYYLGEINDRYPRAALCQKDELHYVVVTANAGLSYWSSPTLHTFAKHIDALGCQKAYTLDGGRTANISMQGKHLNPLQSAERWISDIIYFATAVPSGEE